MVHPGPDPRWVELTPEEYAEMEVAVIAWSDIVAECGNYKSGFVATFRKYEGEPTDEVDGSNRVIKVTAKSFAEHMGIPVQTFRDWIKREVDTNFVSTSAKQARTAASHANVVKNMAKNNPEQLVKAIKSAGISASDQVFHEHKLQRAGVDTSPANRKASEAAAHAVVEPMMQTMHATVGVELVVASLNEAAEGLQEMIDNGACNRRTMSRIEKALEAFQFKMAEAAYHVS